MEIWKIEYRKFRFRRQFQPPHSMSNRNFQPLSNFIWSVAELLRGPYRPPQYERVITVSLETNMIVEGLPQLEIQTHSTP